MKGKWNILSMLTDVIGKTFLKLIIIKKDVVALGHFLSACKASYYTWPQIYIKS